MVNQYNSTPLTENSSFSDNKNLMRLTQDVKSGQQSHKRSIPPLEQWHPKHCGKMDLTIKANGEWWHEGQLIKRQSLLDLFSSVLWKENDRIYLKTPVEQIEIDVEDEPFLVHQVEYVDVAGKMYLQLTTTNQDVIVIDDLHPIFMRDYQGESRPYVHVRFGLNALIQRAAFFHLVELGDLIENAQGQTILCLQSGDFHLQLGT